MKLQSLILLFSALTPLSRRGRVDVTTDYLHFHRWTYCDIYPELQSLFSRELHLEPTCACCNTWAGCRLNSSDPLNCLLIKCWRFYNCVWSRFAILAAGFASRSSSHQEDWQAAKVSSYPCFLISIESNINLNVYVRPLPVRDFSQSPQINWNKQPWVSITLLSWNMSCQKGANNLPLKVRTF